MERDPRKLSFITSVRIKRVSAKPGFTVQAKFTYQKIPEIVNFKPKDILRTSPSLLTATKSTTNR